MSATLAQLVTCYLNTHPTHDTRVHDNPPPPREFDIALTSWRKWLALPGIRPSWAQAAQSALVDLAIKRPTHATVGPAVLRAWASSACADSDVDVIRLWVAGRVWGAPTRFGPVHTYCGLTDHHLVTSLRTSLQEVWGGRLAQAYDAFHVRGSREPFLTKWLWSVGLTLADDAQRPLVLDSRVRATLRLAGDVGSAPCALRAGSAGYTDYLDRVQDVAQQLTSQGRVPADNVEWLLFDRPSRGWGGRPVRHPHLGTGEECFHTWLEAGAPGCTGTTGHEVSETRSAKPEEVPILDQPPSRACDRRGGLEANERSTQREGAQG